MMRAEENVLDILANKFSRLDIKYYVDEEIQKLFGYVNPAADLMATLVSETWKLKTVNARVSVYMGFIIATVVLWCLTSPMVHMAVAIGLSILGLQYAAIALAIGAIALKGWKRVAPTPCATTQAVGMYTFSISLAAAILATIALAQGIMGSQSIVVFIGVSLIFVMLGALPNMVEKSASQYLNYVVVIGAITFVVYFAGTVDASGFERRYYEIIWSSLPRETIRKYLYAKHLSQLRKAVSQLHGITLDYDLEKDLKENAHNYNMWMEGAPVYLPNKIIDVGLVHVVLDWAMQCSIFIYCAVTFGAVGMTKHLAAMGTNMRRWLKKVRREDLMVKFDTNFFDLLKFLPTEGCIVIFFVLERGIRTYLQTGTFNSLVGETLMVVIYLYIGYILWRLTMHAHTDLAADNATATSENITGDYLVIPNYITGVRKGHYGVVLMVTAYVFVSKMVQLAYASQDGVSTYIVFDFLTMVLFLIANVGCGVSERWCARLEPLIGPTLACAAGCYGTALGAIALYRMGRMYLRVFIDTSLEAAPGVRPAEG